MAVEMNHTPLLQGSASARFKKIIRANASKSQGLVKTPAIEAFIQRILKDQRRGN